MKSLFISVAFALVIPLAACTSKNQVASTGGQSSPSSETTQVSATKNWYTYTAKDSSYKAKFPGQPQEDEKSILNKNLGQFKYWQVMYEDKANNRAYMTASIKYPGKSSQYNLGQENIEKELDVIRDGQVQGGKSSVASEKKISFNGFPGREITFKGKQGEVIKSRSLLNPKNVTLYQMVVVAGNGNLAFPEAQAFLDSLAVSK
ncbi:MAG TPA: hypothetical protein V6D14_02390 [Coleofasciculaceae cyanobacterium]|jgi:hypothetical protein